MNKRELNKREFLKILSQEVNKPFRKSKISRQIKTGGIFRSLAADLSDYSMFSTQNDNYKYILFVIDEFSRFLWCKKLINKTAASVKKNLFDVIDETNDKTRLLHVDKGSEFYNKSVESELKKYNITMYSTYSPNKSAIVERVQRTIKYKLQLLFTEKQSNRWIDIIDEVVNEYNNTKHSSLCGYTPTEASKLNSLDESKLYLCMYKSYAPQLSYNIPKFKVGDKVRVARIKGKFEKEGLNWSYEIFEVYKVDTRHPIQYKLKDDQNNIIEGSFLENELQKTQIPDIFLVEKQLGTRTYKGKKQILVKWLGYPSSFNQYIDESDIVN